MAGDPVWVAEVHTYTSVIDATSGYRGAQIQIHLESTIALHGG